MCLGVPLSLSFRDLAIKKQARIDVNEMIRRSSTFADTDIQSLEINRDGDALVVYLDVKAQPNSISSKQVDLVRDALSKEIERPITLNVGVIPIEQFVSDAPLSESQSSLRYKASRKSE